MKPVRTIAAGGWIGMILGALLVAGPARANDDCHCNCYFSLDCESGRFCDFGSAWFIQDECWWRKPKPQGKPGSGCDVDHTGWGECDGHCEDPALAGLALFGGETRANVLEAVRVWSRALDATSLHGGGVVGAPWLAAVDAIDFENPTLAAGIWRMVMDAMVISRGASFVVFPEHDTFGLWDVGVRDLGREPAVYRNGRVAIAVLLREVEAPGSGRELLVELDRGALDATTLDLVCDEADRVECIYGRLRDLARVFREAGRGAVATAGGAETGVVTPSCPGCPGDCVSDDAIDFQDVLELLANWGESYPCGDYDDDGSIGFLDLIALLSQWGNCAPPQ